MSLLLLLDNSTPSNLITKVVSESVQMQEAVDAFRGLVRILTESCNITEIITHGLFVTAIVFMAVFIKDTVQRLFKLD